MTQIGFLKEHLRVEEEHSLKGIFSAENFKKSDKN